MNRPLQRALPRSAGAVRIAAFVGVTVIVVQHEWPSGAGWIAHNAIQLVAPWFLLWAAATGLRDQRRFDRWTMIGFAAINAVNQVVWTATGSISGPTGHGLLVDQIYLVSVPLGFIGLLRISTRGLRSLSWLRVATDSGLMASSLIMISWIALFASSYQQGSLQTPPLDLVVSPAVDILAASVLLVAAIHQPRRPYLRWMAGGVCVAAISDLANAYHLSRGFTSTHLVVMLGWFLAPLFLGVGARTAQWADPDYAVQSRSRLWIYALVGVATLGALFEVITTGQIGVPTVGIAIVMELMIIANQVAVAAEVRELVRTTNDALSLLKLSEQRFRVAFEGSPVGIVVMDAEMIVNANDLFATLFDRQPDTFVGRSIRELVDPGRVLDLEAPEQEISVSHHDGTEVYLALTVARDVNLTDDRSIMIVQDVTERRAALERLAHLAGHDQLTGLANRAAFVDALDQALADTSGAGVAIAFLDLDRFKVINDSLGHATGDVVIEEVSRRIADAVGTDGLVSRFAGDEFTVLLRSADRVAASIVLERVRHQVGEPVSLGAGAVAYPTVSAGVSCFSRGTGTAAMALAQADAAMYRAKALGRNRIEFFDADTTDSGESELRTVGDLHRALERGELRDFYQPIVDVDTGSVDGFEALIRWQHPARGLLQPVEFIEAAESSGIIVELGEWMLRQALNQLATWQQLVGEERRLTMSVNVAARQVTDEFVELLAEVLALTGVDPGAVWLELTETAIMADLRAAEKILNRLAAMGVHLTVDDFGTGYSSLTSLRTFPVDGLKLDKSFTDGLGLDHQSEAICEGVISLGRALGLKTVAEGVEQPIQLERLRDLGCRWAQGYLFGRPVPPTEVHFGAPLNAEAPKAVTIERAR